MQAGRRRAGKGCFIDTDMLPPFTQGEYSPLRDEHLRGNVHVSGKPVTCSGQQRGGLGAVVVGKA